MAFLFYTTIVLFILTCLILIGLVLLQKGRGGGLSGAFGGGGGNTAFGAKTGDVLTWATSIIFGVFVLLAIALNLLANYRQHQTAVAAGGTTPTGTTPTQQTPAMPNLPVDAPAVEKPATPTTVPSSAPAAATPAATPAAAPAAAPTSQPAK